MVVFDVAHLVPHDVGIHVFVGEKGITEEGERALLTTREHGRATLNLTLRRTNDEHQDSPQLEEKQQRHHTDTYEIYAAYDLPYTETRRRITGRYRHFGQHRLSVGRDDDFFQHRPVKQVLLQGRHLRHLQTREQAK